PSSLDAIADKEACRRAWAASDVPHYSLVYEPVKSSSGAVLAFTVKATRPFDPLRAPQNAESDETGETRILDQDPKDNRYPVELGTVTPIGTLWESKICFRDYALGHKATGYPRTWSEVPICGDGVRQRGGTFLSETELKQGDYTIAYAAAAPNRSGKRD